MTEAQYPSPAPTPTPPPIPMPHILMPSSAVSTSHIPQDLPPVTILFGANRYTVGSSLGPNQYPP